MTRTCRATGEALHEAYKAAKRNNGSPGIDGMTFAAIDQSGVETFLEGLRGVPQGGVLSPLLSNLHLNGVGQMLERAKGATRRGRYTYIEYVRFADWKY